MSEAAPAVPPAPAASAPRPPEPRPTDPRPGEQRQITELKVSGHLMTLETGVFCIFQPPGAPRAGEHGLPGVRVSLPPMPLTRPGAVQISTFREDGWLPGGEGAALVRVAEGPAQVLVTVYQAPGAGADAAPRLQVLRLSAEVPAAPPRPSAAAPAADADLVAHIQRTGDVGAKLGEWMGVRGSRLWIEGFAIAPTVTIAGLPAAEAIEYQGLLGRDWLSPWVDGGKFCGSRGMALPLLGLRARLKGAAASTQQCRVIATFGDGTLVGPVDEDIVCQAESLAPLEAFRIEIAPRGAGTTRPASSAGGVSSGASPGASPARPVPPARKPAVRRPR